MAEGKLDLIFWGYVSNVLLSLLKPYKQGTLLELTNEDKEIIKKSEGFLDAILVGCKTVEEPHMLSFRNSSRKSLLLLRLVWQLRFSQRCLYQLRIILESSKKAK